MTEPSRTWDVEMFMTPAGGLRVSSGPWFSCPRNFQILMCFFFLPPEGYIGPDENSDP